MANRKMLLCQLRTSVAIAIVLVTGGCSSDEIVVPKVAGDPWEIQLNRTGWSWASVPLLGSSDPDTRVFSSDDRLDVVRWFLPKERTLRHYLNPDLINQEGDETQHVLDLYLRADNGVWGPESWGGIMCGLPQARLDLSGAQFVELWVNDFRPERALRSGKLHIDFGSISEDGFWPEVEGVLETGTYQNEDANSDGVLTHDEDVGLGGAENGPQRFGAEYEVNGDFPYPFINGTARNSRIDSEDLDGDGLFSTANRYHTTVIDLGRTEAIVDVVYDYEDVQDLIDRNIAWRKYRVSFSALYVVSGGDIPDLGEVSHIRVWFEDDSPVAGTQKWLQFSGLKFSSVAQ